MFLQVNWGAKHVPIMISSPGSWSTTAIFNAVVGAYVCLLQLWHFAFLLQFSVFLIFKKLAMMGLYCKCPSWSWKKNEWIFNLFFWTGLGFFHIVMFVCLCLLWDIYKWHKVDYFNHFWVYNSMALVTFVACAIITIIHFRNLFLTPNSNSITIKYWLSIQLFFSYLPLRCLLEIRGY